MIHLEEERGKEAQTGAGNDKGVTRNQETRIVSLHEPLTFLQLLLMAFASKHGRAQPSTSCRCYRLTGVTNRDSNSHQLVWRSPTQKSPDF